MFEASGDMSASNTSVSTNVEQVDKASIHLSWTAGPVGIFKLQSRNGSKSPAQPNTKYNDTWFDVDFGTTMSISGTDSELLIQLNEMPGTEIRIVYTATSGSASDLKALLTMKAVGA
jgi:hypothetical protein